MYIGDGHWFPSSTVQRSRDGPSSKHVVGWFGQWHQFWRLITQVLTNDVPLCKIRTVHEKSDLALYALSHVLLTTYKIFPLFI